MITAILPLYSSMTAGEDIDTGKKNINLNVLDINKVPRLNIGYHLDFGELLSLSRYICCGEIKPVNNEPRPKFEAATGVSLFRGTSPRAIGKCVEAEFRGFAGNL